MLDKKNKHTGNKKGAGFAQHLCTLLQWRQKEGLYLSSSALHLSAHKCGMLLSAYHQSTQYPEIVGLDQVLFLNIK